MLTKTFTENYTEPTFKICSVICSTLDINNIIDTMFSL